MIFLDDADISASRQIIAYYFLPHLLAPFHRPTGDALAMIFRRAAGACLLGAVYHDADVKAENI